MIRRILAEAGEPRLVDEAPRATRPDRYVVASTCSLISTGTEMWLLEESRQSGGRQSLGYSVVGRLLRSGADVPPIPEGARVACSGIQFSPHAERISVGRHNLVRVPDGVSDRAAAFTTLGTTAIHAVRQGGVQLGDRVLVMGLGLLGQLVAQVARAAGAVVGVADPHAGRARLALELGAHRELEAGRLAEEARDWTEGRGADCVVVCTAGGEGHYPAACAAARDRGTIVGVGVTQLDLPRDAFFRRELQLRSTRAYGPGRYDPQYEEGGIDYPYGYVRWTEHRNQAEFVRLLADGLVRTEPLITHEFPIARGIEAYELLRTQRPTALGVVLRYDGADR